MNALFENAIMYTLNSKDTFLESYSFDFEGWMFGRFIASVPSQVICA